MASDDRDHYDLVRIIRHARTDPDKPAYYQPDAYTADLILAAGWVPKHVAMEAAVAAGEAVRVECNRRADALAATVQRVRELCDAHDGDHSCTHHFIDHQLRAVLYDTAPPPGPAAPGGHGEGRA